MVWVTPWSKFDLFGLGQWLRLNKKRKLLWKTAILAVCWAMWAKRGLRVQLRILGIKIKFWVAIWLVDVNEFRIAFSELGVGVPWCSLVDFLFTFLLYLFFYQ